MLKQVLNYTLLIIALFMFGYYERMVGFHEGFDWGRKIERQFGEQEASTTFVRAVVPEITRCESNDRHDRWGDEGAAYGIAQFHERTFNWMRKLAGHPELQWKSEHDQRWLLTWAIEHGYGKHWQRCYRKAAKKYANEIVPVVLAATGTPGNLFNLEVTF